MKIESIILGLLFICNLSSISQTSLNKVVVDSKTKLPIEFVNIYSENKEVNLLSSIHGKFTINYDLNIKTYMKQHSASYTKNT